QVTLTQSANLQEPCPSASTLATEQRITPAISRPSATCCFVIFICFGFLCCFCTRLTSEVKENLGLPKPATPDGSASGQKHSSNPQLQPNPAWKGAKVPDLPQTSMNLRFPPHIPQRARRDSRPPAGNDNPQQMFWLLDQLKGISSRAERRHWTPSIPP